MVRVLDLDQQVVGSNPTRGKSCVTTLGKSLCGSGASSVEMFSEDILIFVVAVLSLFPSVILHGWLVGCLGD